MFRIKKQFIYFLIIVIIFTSCGNSSKPLDKISVSIVLTKDVLKKIKGQYVYLTTTYPSIVLDSILVDKDTIVFNLNVDSTFFPSTARVTHKETYNGHLIFRPLGFTSPYNKKAAFSDFYIDRGLTRIITIPEDSSYNKKYIDTIDNTYSFLGSNQNIPFFKQVFLTFPEDKKDSTKRRQIIKSNIQIIKEYPYSMFLLEGLSKYKQHFKNEELKTMISFFDGEVKKSTPYRELEDYFLISKQYDNVFPFDIKLQNESGIFMPIGNLKAQCNLFVFWACWCGPCREEIPTLKKLYAHYKNSGLSITSISIDTDTSKWQTALDQEKMEWGQFIARDSTAKVIEKYYNVSVIPKIYLFDKEKKLIKKYEGVSFDLERDIVGFPVLVQVKTKLFSFHQPRHFEGVSVAQA